MPGKLELLKDGPLLQLKGMFGPLFQKGILEPLFQPLFPLFHGILLPPHDGTPLPQPMFGPPPHDGPPLPMLKPLPGPLPHDWLLPQFMLGFMSKLSKPQPPALALPAIPAKTMLAIIFFMVLLPSYWVTLIRKQAG